jgi:thiol:disulfide interchange protein DsbD
MNQIARFAALSFLFCFSYSHLFSQDSVAAYKWNISAKKIDEKKYELSFSTAGIKGWQLYSPVQSIPDFHPTELKFGDSDIIHSNNYSESGELKKITSPVFDNKNVNSYEGSTEWKTVINIKGTVPAQLQGILDYSYGRNDEFYTGEFSFNVSLEGGVISTTRIRIESIDINNPVNKCGDEVVADKSFFTIFLLGFAGGLLALITPCVFPMIPVTVSFFTQRASNRKRGIFNAAMYGFFIFFIYLLTTLPFHIASKTVNPEIYNNISTSPLLNIFFFLVFIVFAFSFFGFYEIGLPSALANRFNRRASAGDFAGIFFMAATLTIVSFSCTGIVLGTLLAGVADKGAWPLTYGVAGFGLALGFPFALFAMFPNWLKSIPKSGGWLHSVKVVLGFLEIAMALKFLSNADLVKQWGLLKRETFIAIWIVIGIAIILYLLGKIRFPHQTPVKKISNSRILFIILFSLITIYFIPGVTNTRWANLKLISGFPPPLCYSLYENPVNCKRGFEPLRDYETALTFARKENKPILIDFTGWACVNCRRMEESVWTNTEVDSLMREKFVVVSLYVDEKRKLPIQQRMVYVNKKNENVSINTVGDKWSNFQIENFNATSQPQYAIISSDEKALAKTKGYTPDPSKFASWLKCGLEAFKKTSAKN